MRPCKTACLCSWQSLDLQNERVNLAKHDTCNVASLVRHVPTDGARYHFYKFVHTFEGDELHSIGQCYKTKSQLKN